MIIHDVAQKSPEWDELRAGRLTASQAGKLVTPTGKASVQYRSEIARIIAEHKGWQEPEFIKPTYWMERGINMEAEARAWLQVDTGMKINSVGFLEDGLFGASPDGYIEGEDMSDGSQVIIPVELKCPKPSTHVKWLIEGGMPKEHIAQVHFQIVISGAPFAMFMSYTPDCRPLVIKVERSDYTKLMTEQMKKYRDEFIAAFKTVTGEDYAEV